MSDHPLPVEGPRTALSLTAYRERVGQELGVSAWVDVTQDMMDRFAELTHDKQFIHIDPERAAKTPFGSTVAHGFLTLSLLSVMAYDAVPSLEGSSMGVNYGFDRLRFVTPVRPGSRVRGRFMLRELAERSATELMIRVAATVEIEGQDRPAIVADWLTLRVLD
ncbi:nodulation protein NodN [Alsobacter soli]|uniref:Nodulation protein NodN n=1 Tax=Alsobacter soli TaxID=2109933 RepID=A0A2T1HZA9_9HYPH|nr:MaoC family dehydratase [Alsobacter soli]PSC07036.1 nodulation protein NodN [Alsobacter soli]